MVKQSRSLFLFFLWLYIASYLAIVLYSVIGLIFADVNAFFQYTSVALYLLCLFTVWIYFKPKLNVFLKFLILITAFIAVFYGLDWLVYLLSGQQSKMLFPLVNIGIAVFFYAMAWSGISPVKSQFNKLFKVFDSESEFKDPKAYIKWLGEEFGEQGDKIKATWFLGRALGATSLALLLSFFSLIRFPEGKWYLSVFFCLFIFAALGVYLVLYQFSSLIKWKFYGYQIKEEMIKNWNRLIKLAYIPLLTIPFIIPWNYQIVEVTFFREILDGFFKHYARDISQVTNIEAQGQDGTNVVFTQSGQQALGDLWSNYFVVFRAILTIIGVIFGIYTVFAIIGGLFYLIFRDKKVPGFIGFFIRSFKSYIGFFYSIFSMLRSIVEGLLSLLGIGVEKVVVKTELERKLEQRMMQMFKNYDHLTSEKIEEIKTIIKEFIRLIQTASRTVTPYAFYMGPKEYVNKIIEKLPSYTKELQQIVSTFNESRYSLHLLSVEKKEMFRHNIQVVIEKMETK